MIIIYSHTSTFLSLNNAMIISQEKPNKTDTDSFSTIELLVHCKKKILLVNNLVALNF